MGNTVQSSGATSVTELRTKETTFVDPVKTEVFKSFIHVMGEAWAGNDGNVHAYVIYNSEIQGQVVNEYFLLMRTPPPGMTALEYMKTIEGHLPLTLSPFQSVPEVPIPSTVWLLGSGLLGLIGVARRKAA